MKKTRAQINSMDKKIYLVTVFFVCGGSTLILPRINRLSSFAQNENMFFL
jgi:hypothetical protein